MTEEYEAENETLTDEDIAAEGGVLEIEKPYYTLKFIHLCSDPGLMKVEMKDWKIFEDDEYTLCEIGIYDYGQCLDIIDFFAKVWGEEALEDALEEAFDD